MRKKNDRIIVFGMMGLGFLAMACVVAVLGIGAYVYTNDDNKPTPTPTQAPTVVPTASVTAAPSGEIRANPLYVKNLLSDEGDRTYTLNIELMAGADPVDMSRVTANIIADGQTYKAWDFRYGEHSSTGNSNVILERGETFTMTIYAPQTGLPLNTKSTVEIVLLLDGRETTSLYASAI